MNIVGGFNYKYWQKFGISWLASLKDFAKFTGKIIIFENDFPETLKSKLINLNIILYHFDKVYEDFRLNILLKIGELPIGKYVYWDGDCMFLKDVSNAFQERIGCSRVNQQPHPSMFVAETKYWQLLNKFADYSKIKCSKELISCFVDALNLKEIDQTWNYSCLNDKKEVNVLHLGDFKLNQEYLFENKYPRLYARWNSCLNNKPIFNCKIRG